MKIIYVLIAVFLFPNIGKAQHLEIGLRTGINLSKLRTSDYSGTGITGGTEILKRANASLTLEYPISAHSALDMGLGYQGKGGGNFEEGNKLHIEMDAFERKLEYLGLTVLYRYYPLNESDLQPFVILGPGVSYLISAKQLGYKIEGDNLRNKLEISSIVGIGIKYIFIGDLNLELLGGLDRGWSKTLRQQNESLYNEVFWISAGIKKIL